MSSENTERTTECYSCGVTLAIVDDEWWSHSWQEEPSKESIEEAMDDPDSRDWFQTNYVLCPDCHEAVIEVVEDE